MKNNTFKVLGVLGAFLLLNAVGYAQSSKKGET